MKLFEKIRVRILVASFLSFPVVCFSGQNAAPSSDLVFDDNFAGFIILNEVRVPGNGEAKYTYYETLGWRGHAAGYAGIQAHPKGHNYIFSIIIDVLLIKARRYQNCIKI